MKKKILMAVVAVVMLFATMGFAGCIPSSTPSDTPKNPCGQEPCICETDTPTLADYKAAAIVQLQNFVAELDEDDFSGENWQRILGYLESGKAAINAAEDKAVVRAARDTAKQNIDAVPQNGGSNGNIPVGPGTFYRLAEAYDNGWLTVNDLKNISYHRHQGRVTFNGQAIEFTPSPKMPLETAIETQIKQDFLELLVSMSLGTGSTIDDIVLVPLGTYNGSVAVTMSSIDLISIPIGLREYAGGVLFLYGPTVFIRIWRPNQENDNPSVEPGTFYRLTEAYDNGWLTVNDLKNISYHWHQGRVTFNGQVIEFTPSPKIPLETVIETQIKQDFLKLANSYNGRITIDDITFGRYLGIYNENVAVFLAIQQETLPVVSWEYVSGISFRYGNQGFLLYIHIWRPNQN